jgi:hypothetical protein
MEEFEVTGKYSGYTGKIIPGVGYVRVPIIKEYSLLDEALFLLKIVCSSVWLVARTAAIIAGLVFLATR